MGIRSVTGSVRLLLPLGPSSVTSVTKSAVRFLRLLRFFAANFPTLSPRITRIARIKNQPSFSLFPPVKSVRGFRVFRGPPSGSGRFVSGEKAFSDRWHRRKTEVDPR